MTYRTLFGICCLMERADLAVFFTASLALSACITHLEEEESAIGRVERDCLVPVPAGVERLGAPVSLEYPDHSLWIWDELPMENGGTAAAPSAVVASADEVCAAGLVLVEDALGEPVPMLRLTPEEAG